MVVNDPVGDMITRIRNAVMARHDKLTLPSSKLKAEVAKALKDEGFIADFVTHEKKPQNELTIMLKYDIPRVKGGMGIAILSTSHGVMADHEARKANVGGELICTVY